MGCLRIVNLLLFLFKLNKNIAKRERVRKLRNNEHIDPIIRIPPRKSENEGIRGQLSRNLDLLVAVRSAPA